MAGSLSNRRHSQAAVLVPRDSESRKTVGHCRPNQFQEAGKIQVGLTGTLVSKTLVLSLIRLSGPFALANRRLQPLGHLSSMTYAVQHRSRKRRGSSLVNCTGPHRSFIHLDSVQKVLTPLAGGTGLTCFLIQRSLFHIGRFDRADRRTGKRSSFR